MKQPFAAFGLICFCFLRGIAPAQSPAPALRGPRYLALGDSVTFGYNPTVAVNLNNYHGYPEFVSAALQRGVANASCPGETTESFFIATAPDNGCHAWKLFGGPLFVPYSGTQLDYALSFLRNNPKPDLVTINLGANDLFLVLEHCGLDLNCDQSGLPAMFAAYGRSLFTIFASIRLQARYEGPMVLLTYYVANYHEPVEVTLFTELNGIASGIASAFGVKIADGFNAFQLATIPFAGDACAAGLLVRLPSGGCDVHPSLAGQKLLAEAVLLVAR